MAPKLTTVEHLKYSKRVVLKSIVGRDDGGVGLAGERVVVGGWVKSCTDKAEPVVAVADVTYPEVLMSRIPILGSIARILGGRKSVPVVKAEGGQSRTVSFVAWLRINDGSCVASLQVVAESSLYPLEQITHVGTSVLVEGVIVKIPAPKKHSIELKAEKILHVGSMNIETYPLRKSRLSLDTVRSYPHLRPRASMGASVARIRNSLFNATHLFFQSNGFLHVHMPIITTMSSRADAKMFQVSTLLNKLVDIEKTDEKNDKEDINIEVVKDAIKEKSARIEELKRTDSNKEALIGALQDLQKAHELALQLEEKQQSKALSVMDKILDFSKDFFLRRAYLSTSPELHLESYACALSSVYTFGPTFEADKDVKAAKNLAERWTIDVALAFAELEDAMNCAEDCLKFLCHKFLESCPDDLILMSKRVDNNCTDRLKSVCSRPFPRITYTEALDFLKKADDGKFDAQAEWGISLSREHESYLADVFFKQPVIIYEYPKEIKPFYVREADNEKTVSAFDIIAPKVGVLVQGSQKEERLKKITTRLEETGLSMEQYEWYLDIRRHGTVKHSGFSLAFENLVMFVTGIDNVKDVIPFPRTRGSAGV
ncbi:uncharacterized protein A4U43_C02F15580 [Asparagus officinalis]|uniref:Aminoacyl-tRNA synthetase class II (D/K/N) domain-containing protein n=1 Tax=Asparagus officinalis TaxID=4686 RepID=A0A5P1FNJ2_ASPOF|nr:asparagine--tRNA ligase, cytoplasmic 2-like [Asparagus officinalis]ONK78200.1 uncharacterized protein A4U43_C02F15580 [Asparagus officinalis]